MAFYAHIPYLNDIRWSGRSHFRPHIGAFLFALRTTNKLPDCQMWISSYIARGLVPQINGLKELDSIGGSVGWWVCASAVWNVGGNWFCLWIGGSAGRRVVGSVRWALGRAGRVGVWLGPSWSACPFLACLVRPWLNIQRVECRTSRDP